MLSNPGPSESEPSDAAEDLDPSRGGTRANAENPGRGPGFCVRRLPPRGGRASLHVGQDA